MQIYSNALSHLRGRIWRVTQVWDPSGSSPMVSVIILFINELGDCRQLNICCALINGACTWETNQRIRVNS